MQILLEFKIIASAALNMSECSILCTNWVGCAEKTTFYAEKRTHFRWEKTNGHIIHAKRGSLEGQFTGISSRIFKGGNAKKGFCNTFTLYYILKVCFEKKIAHRIEKNIKIKNILELIWWSVTDRFELFFFAKL